MEVLANVSVWWHVVGTAIIVVILFIVPDGPSVVHLRVKNLTGWSFPGVGLYVFFIGMLIAQYTITGFDASAHVSEETRDANVRTPEAMSGRSTSRRSRRGS